MLPAAGREQLNALLSSTWLKVLAVDSIVYENFGAGDTTAGSRFRREQERLLLPPVSFLNNYEALLALQQLQNAWRQLNLRVAALFHEQTSHVVLHCLDYDFPIVNQNAAVLQTGGRLHIEAGIGRISTRSQPHVFVGGKEVVLSESGMAQWNRKVPTRPGHYSLPVRITFMDQDGKEQIVTKTVAYEVISCTSDSLIHP
ncbi:MAG: hypothetical protein EOP50_13785 [Sphingobacteriales bacterium]|nr:MAG: hypothetical protein EOP50_13785 [Sphingobacteriales bacterium]